MQAGNPDNLRKTYNSASLMIQSSNRTRNIAAKGKDRLLYYSRYRPTVCTSSAYSKCCSEVTNTTIHTTARPVVELVRTA